MFPCIHARYEPPVRRPPRLRHSRRSVSRRSVIRCCWIIWPKGIPSGIAARECVEVHYRTRGKWYFGIGFRNAGRAAWRYATLISKGSTSPKEISPMSGIQRIKMRDRRYWCSRGFMDYLSYLARSNRDSRSGLRGAQFGRQPARGVGRAGRLRACLLFPGQRWCGAESDGGDQAAVRERDGQGGALPAAQGPERVPAAPSKKDGGKRADPETGKRVKNKEIGNPGMNHQGGYMTGQAGEFLPACLTLSGFGPH